MTVSGQKTETVEHPAETHEEKVEETGHWELAALSAKPVSKPQQAADNGNKPESKQAAAKKALPQTGDAQAAHAAGAIALAGVAALAAARHLRRED